MKTGIELIAYERQRQIDVYGYTDEYIKNSPEDYGEGDLAFASAAYLMTERWLTKDSGYIPELLFPWDMTYFKPSPNDRIKELSKAGAMIVAEIDRLLKIQQSVEELQQYAKAITKAGNDAFFDTGYRPQDDYKAFMIGWNARDRHGAFKCQSDLDFPSDKREQLSWFIVNVTRLFDNEQLKHLTYAIGERCGSDLVSKWIQCSERLPDIEEDVWIWFNDRPYRAHLMTQSDIDFHGFKSGIYWDDTELFRPITGVICWQPYILPQPPQI